MSEDLMPFDLPISHSAIIKVFGVGGGGSNAVNHMYKQGIKDVDFIICNTDSQALDSSPVPEKIQLGATLTQGRGAGNKPDQGKQAAIESLEDVANALKSETKMIFITAGMGGGTGTGAAPVIAKIAKELGILTVAIVTIPFKFEGQLRVRQAVEGIKELNQHVDSLLVINNEKLREIHGDLMISEAFAKADNILTVAAKGIAEIITVHGYINVDFADVETVMTDSGVALMGSAIAEGEDRAASAVKNALNSPLLNNNDINGAKNILLNISSGTDDIRMDEVSEITDYIQEATGYSADLIWGNSKDETLGDKISVTVIATGFETDIIPEVYKTQKKVKETVKLEDEEIIIKNDNEIIFEIDNKKTEKFDIEEKFSTDSEFKIVDKEEQTEAQKIDKLEKQDNDNEYSVAARKALERMKELKKKQTSKKQTRYTQTSHAKNIDELENEPAYIRKRIKIDNKNHSQDSNVSRYTLTEDDEKNTIIKSNNSYLHDNVD